MAVKKKKTPMRKATTGRAKPKTAKRVVARPKAAKPKAAMPKKAAQKTSQKGLALRSVSPSFTVDDVEKSLTWYRDVMGFAAGERWEDGGKLMGIELTAGSVVFMIGQDDWNKGRDRVKGGGFRLYCQSDQDIDRLADGIKARGGTLAQEPRDEEWGARAFTVVDPDGFRITISSPTKG